MLDRTRALSTSIVLFALAFAAAAPAAAWDVRRDATEADFTDFARRFASAAYAYPRHPAGPLGVVGFEVYGEASYDEKFDEQPFFGGAVDGDLDGGFLSIARAGVRKGLPGGVDLGVSVGEAVGTDLKFGTAEIQWAFVKGGALSPAVALRVTGTRMQGGNGFDLSQGSVEILASKGFPVVTPYVGAGLVASRARLDRTGTLSDLSDDHVQPIAYAGVRLSLLIPKITAEIERGQATQLAVRVAFGF